MESNCRFASTKSKTAEHFKTKSQVVRPVILSWYAAHGISCKIY